MTTNMERIIDLASNSDGPYRLGEVFIDERTMRATVRDVEWFANGINIAISEDSTSVFTHYARLNKTESGFWKVRFDAWGTVPIVIKIAFTHWLGSIVTQ